ncbi:MAG TPA: mechanosensitive ion channel protein, partial [Alteromonas sp.]|nr:mechanosensitive ion channel protein [Alteromonas sp.]
MQTFEQVKNFLSTELFTLFDITFTTGGLIAVPLLYVVGIWVIRKLAHLATYRLRSSGASPDTIHLFKRIFYILAMAILVVT